jgi:hypothetical protein
MHWNIETAYFHHYYIMRNSVEDFANNYSHGDCPVLIICHAETNSDFYRWLLYNKLYCNRRYQGKNGRNLYSGHVTFTCSYFGHTAHIRTICFFPYKN